MRAGSTKYFTGIDDNTLPLYERTTYQICVIIKYNLSVILEIDEAYKFKCDFFL